MPTNINTFKGFVEFCSNKNQSGNTISPSQFNLVADQAQMVLFEKDYQTYLQTDEVSEFLSLFLKNQTTMVSTSGTLAYPSDLQHISSIRSYYVRPSGSSTEVPVVAVKNGSWGDISTSQLQAPTKRFPKYSEFATEIRFLPKLLGSVMVDYFKRPTIPVWGYTIVSGRPVYDPSTSINFEFDEFSVNNVAAVYLQLIGINLKSGELAAFSTQFKQETNSTF